jgi:HEPN domain-containing protein
MRLREARVLLNNGNYEGAYYLCDYVVECGLKACIAKRTKRYDFPDKKSVNESFTHNLATLVKVAGLQSVLDQATANDPTLRRYWAVVRDWSEESRYQKPTEQEAGDLWVAITDSKHGVLRWLKRYW